jgi:hypothetical protein
MDIDIEFSNFSLEHIIKFYHKWGWMFIWCNSYSLKYLRNSIKAWKI